MEAIEASMACLLHQVQLALPFRLGRNGLCGLHPEVSQASMRFLKDDFVVKIVIHTRRIVYSLLSCWNRAWMVCVLNSESSKKASATLRNEMESFQTVVSIPAYRQVEDTTTSALAHCHILLQIRQVYTQSC